MGWQGSFYLSGLKPADYLSYYAQHFNTVKVDSTFYRIPSLSTVRGWHAKTPAGFIFAAKIPQTITHERVLVDCDAELDEVLPIAKQIAESLEYARERGIVHRDLKPTRAKITPGTFVPSRSEPLN